MFIKKILKILLDIYVSTCQSTIMSYYLFRKEADKITDEFCHLICISMNTIQKITWNITLSQYIEK